MDIGRVTNVLHISPASFFGYRCTFQTAFFVIRLEALAYAEYYIYFRARLGDIHAIGYNPAESDPIGRKSGTL